MKTRVWWALNLFAILFGLYVVYNVITGGWDEFWRYFGPLMWSFVTVGIWELIRWVNSPSFYRCPTEGCTFRIRVNDKKIEAEVMENHLNYYHNIWT